VLIDHVIAGRYRITELIGQGGMGTVFEAVHTGTGSRVALKLIVSADIKQEVFVRFQREARAAGTIDSHHIVRVFDMGTDDRSGSPYMAMERLYGEDLSDVMKRVGPMSPPLAVALAAQAALGLAKAHDAGIVHRDIKPANLFLHDGSDRGEVVVKILDFGIAKVLMDTMQKAEEGGLTRTGSMLGSPHYMSPEQAQGLRTIDQRSDIWSLGVVLYKMLTGQTPHAHLQTLGQVILAICSQPARPVQELAPWVPPEIAAIVHRALQPDPRQRFQSAHEMYHAMQPILARLPPARRSDIVPLTDIDRMRVVPSVHFRTDVPTNTHNGMTHAATAHGAAPSTRSSTMTIAVVAAALMLTVGAAGIFVSVRGKHRTAATAPTTTSSTLAATGEPAGGTGTAGAGADPVEATGTVPALATRSVTLTVPPTATVEVDGVKRENVQGTVQLDGPLGAVVAVRVSANGVETTQRVAITEGGAMPPKVTLAGGSHGAGGHGTAKATPTAPSATGTGVNVQRNFE